MIQAGCGRKLASMPSRGIRPEQVSLRHLYVDERLPMREIAARLGCGPTTIARCLRRFGIEARPRGPAPLRDGSGMSWSSAVADAIGLIATDGNLSRDGRHISVVSKDLDLLEALRRCLGLRVAISEFQSARGRRVGPVQWSHRAFYDALLTIGLTPAKSLTLGPLAVPDKYFADFFRGCIDGDGSILVYIDRPTQKGASPGLATPLCQARIRRTPPLDVLRSRPAGSSAQAGQGRALHVEDALESCGSGAGVEKLAYSWRSKRHARKGLGVRLPSPAPFLDKIPRAPVGFVGVGL